MKKLWLLVPFIAFSCNQKQETVNETTTYEDSVLVEAPAETEAVNQEPQKLPDSVINSSESVQEVLRSGVMRQENDKEIVRMADAEMLPFSLGEEIKNDNQDFILKIAGYDKPTIKAEIITEDGRNIRFNQVKYSDGTFDGPFGKTLEVENKGTGEIWLIVGRSNMASGSPVGKFTIRVD